MPPCARREEVALTILKIRKVEKERLSQNRIRTFFSHLATGTSVLDLDALSPAEQKKKQKRKKRRRAKSKKVKGKKSPRRSKSPKTSKRNAIHNDEKNLEEFFKQEQTTDFGSSMDVPCSKEEELNSKPNNDNHSDNSHETLETFSDKSEQSDAVSDQETKNPHMSTGEIVKEPHTAANAETGASKSDTPGENDSITHDPTAKKSSESNNSDGDLPEVANSDSGSDLQTKARKKKRIQPR
eukprot:TRINITY_DN2001_c0_g1_i4.p2 TRINITY_DN2001_c0_g1~~TRINITY_DN2001_c0_g1_i4.p2  ORF type:complete len:240 (+),score=47.84 TRINITY_DN2001_c0_g1_i4:660-1379(+)